MGADEDHKARADWARRTPPERPDAEDDSEEARQARSRYTGKSQEYLRGECTWTRFTWNDSEKRLTIEPEPRMEGKPLPRRTFSVVLLPEGTRKTVEFDGAKSEVSFAPTP